MEPLESCSEPGKLFVGGISWETREETLRDHFKKYGDVSEALIMRDRSTGNGRGFGFVQFLDPASADRALSGKNKHVILGRMVEVKRAIPRSEQPQYPNQNHYQNGGVSKSNSNSNSGSHSRTKKIFVGGLSASLTEDEFRSYFEKFGRITDVVVMYDSVTQRPRGFGFITFDSEEAVENVMHNTFHTLNDKLVEVKIAVPKDGFNNSNWSNNIRTSNSSRMSGQRGGSIDNFYEGGVFPTYSPTRYGLFNGYGPAAFFGYGYGAGCYTVGGYGGIGYGAPFASSPRIPFNGGPGLAVSSRQSSPVPYSDAALYPGYFNGGYMGMDGSVYFGIAGSANGKWNQSGGAIADTVTG